MSLIRYFIVTIYYLKISQIWYRLIRHFRFSRLPSSSQPLLRIVKGPWLKPIEKNTSMLGPNKFIFLNKKIDFGSQINWEAPNLPKLWKYNLHYFDDLNAKGSGDRLDWHLKMMESWVALNPIGYGTGWEPYPVSLRIVNWFKWYLKGNALSPDLLNSLVQQIRFLDKNIEYHLLGNHVLANAKALIFAGVLFEKNEASDWRKKGVSLFEREIKEQILADGGHFERSAMYHSIILEDVLDLLNLVNLFPNEFCGSFHENLLSTAKKMSFWLRAMCHPDGEIAFFNDSAMNIAPTPSKIIDFQRSLEVPLLELGKGVVELKCSGYVRVEAGDAVLLVDVGKLGPDYQLGHAHADTLSYELSLFGRRFIVNSGTSTYEVGSVRSWQRGTAAHSTLEINKKDSSEVWAGFRVARRANVFDVEVTKQGPEVIITGAHDGYSNLDSKPIHKREWRICNSHLKVTDLVFGFTGDGKIRNYFHPDVSLLHEKAIIEDNQFSSEVRWDCSETTYEIQCAEWFPFFGIEQKNQCLEIDMKSGRVSVDFFWNGTVV